MNLVGYTKYFVNTSWLYGAHKKAYEDGRKHILDNVLAMRKGRESGKHHDNSSLLDHIHKQDRNLKKSLILHQFTRFIPGVDTMTDYQRSIYDNAKKALKEVKQKVA